MSNKTKHRYGMSNEDMVLINILRSPRSSVGGYYV